MKIFSGSLSANVLVILAGVMTWLPVSAQPPGWNDPFPAHKVMDKLDSLVAKLSDELEPIHEKGFIVNHDAYQYFEQRFDLAAISSITVSPEVMPGSQSVGELRKKIS